MASSGKRTSRINRQTKETQVSLSLEIDGRGQADIQTGVPFMDHMLTLLTVHGFFDLTINATGDTDIDDHHTVEDIGICLGRAFNEALDNFNRIRRYGQCLLPMDETLAQVALDFSNRPHLHLQTPVLDQKVGSFDTQLVREFLRAFSLHGGITLHIQVDYGDNTHHILEAIFKGLGRSLDQATMIESRTSGPLSSKGTL